MHAPNGPSFARTGSTCTHWWSPVASAKPSMRNWSIASHALAPSVADGRREFAGMREHAGRRAHGVEGRAHHACWLLTDSTSPVMYDA